MRTNSKSVHKSTTSALTREEKIRHLLSKGKLTAEEIFFLEVEYISQYFKTSKEIFSAKGRDKIHNRLLRTEEELKRYNALLGATGVLPTILKMLATVKHLFVEAEGFLKTLILFQDELRIKNQMEQLLETLLQNPREVLSKLPDTQLPTDQLSTAQLPSDQLAPSLKKSATLFELLGSKKKIPSKKIADLLLSKIDFPLVKIMQDSKEEHLPEIVLDKVNQLLRPAYSKAMACTLFANRVNGKGMLAEIENAKLLFEQNMIFFHSTMPSEVGASKWLRDWSSKKAKPFSNFLEKSFPQKIAAGKFNADWPTKARLQKATSYIAKCPLDQLDINKLAKMLDS